MPWDSKQLQCGYLPTMTCTRTPTLRLHVRMWACDWVAPSWRKSVRTLTQDCAVQGWKGVWRGRSPRCRSSAITLLTVFYAAKFNGLQSLSKDLSPKTVNFTMWKSKLAYQTQHTRTHTLMWCDVCVALHSTTHSVYTVYTAHRHIVPVSCLVYFSSTLHIFLLVRCSHARLIMTILLEKCFLWHVYTYKNYICKGIP